MMKNSVWSYFEHLCYVEMSDVYRTFVWCLPLFVVPKFCCLHFCVYLAVFFYFLTSCLINLFIYLLIWLINWLIDWLVIQKSYLEVGKSSEYKRRCIERQHEEISGIVYVNEVGSHANTVHLPTRLPQQPCTAPFCHQHLHQTSIE